jgi:hypothetical protein
MFMHVFWVCFEIGTNCFLVVLIILMKFAESTPMAAKHLNIFKPEAVLNKLPQIRISTKQKVYIQGFRASTH